MRPARFWSSFPSVRFAERKNQSSRLWAAPRLAIDDRRVGDVPCVVGDLARNKSREMRARQREPAGHRAQRVRASTLPLVRRRFDRQLHHVLTGCLTLDELLAHHEHDAANASFSRSSKMVVHLLRIWQFE
jgi:hypothetical protein